MPKLAGMERRSLAANGANEFDIVAQYALPDNGTEATIYLFHAGIPSVPLWFDRSRAAIEHRDAFGLSAGAAIPATSFAPPGSEVASALRISYPVTKAPFSSTALAVLPIGHWIVALRMTSRHLDAAALDTQVSDLIAAIRWPAPATAAPAAIPVLPCDTSLRFRKAKPVKPDATQMVLASILGVSTTKTDRALPTYCRDGENKAERGIYRVPGGEGYVIGLGDSGRAIGIHPLPALGKAAPAAPVFAVTFFDLSRTMNFPSFDRLPAPEQVIEMAGRERPLSITESNGTNSNITVDGDRLLSK